MALTPAQEAKKAAANTRNENAKLAWQGWVNYWSKHFLNIPCYSDTNSKYAIENVISWGFMPTDDSCSSGGTCGSDGKKFCKDEIADVRENIGNIKSAYTELGLAHANYDQVLKDIDKEIITDPDFKKSLAEIEASAQATRLRWIFGIVVLVIVSAGVFIWWKWIRKKS